MQPQLRANENHEVSRCITLLAGLGAIDRDNIENGSGNNVCEVGLVRLRIYLLEVRVLLLTRTHQR